MVCPVVSMVGAVCPAGANLFLLDVRLRISVPLDPQPSQPLKLKPLQDYNREVLQTVTMPNVAANWDAWQLRGFVPTHAGAAAGAGQLAAPRSSGGGCSEQRGEGMAPPVRYFNGDWAALGRVLGSAGLAGGYDVALSAETIYSLESMRSLYRCILEVRDMLAVPAWIIAAALSLHSFALAAPVLPLDPGVKQLPAHTAVLAAAQRRGICGGQVLLLWCGGRHCSFLAAGQWRWRDAGPGGGGA